MKSGCGEEPNPRATARLGVTPSEVGNHWRVLVRGLTNLTSVPNDRFGCHVGNRLEEVCPRSPQRAALR